MLRPILLTLALFSASSLLAQIGDKAGEAQHALVPANLIPPSPALSPEDELRTFQVAPGFRVELVASEPLIGDPVAAVFDPDGRLWVVEMRSYMPTLDGHGEDQPVGRVVVLTDKDGDGRMDESRVFLDGLIMPRAIAIVKGGALIGAPPMLWYCRDTDGDGKADEKIEIARDFGTQTDPKKPELANPERAPNGLLWALDNSIYVGAYTAKFRLRPDGQWERSPSTFRGQWGLSQDDCGHLFYNNNSDQLRADLLPTHYFARNPNYPRANGSNIKVAASQLVWPARVNPGINRGYRPEMLRDYKLKEFTAACAPWIYRGDLFGPEFYGNAFVCEPAGNLVKRNVLTAEKGTLIAVEAYEQREFLTSTDERFRPVNLLTGPEGALYLVDFYRGVIQHRISLTTYLRQQSEARGLADPRGLGRIWRIVPEKSAPKTRPQLSTASAADLVKHLSHPNAWWRETAQQLLVEKRDLSVVPALVELAASGPAPLGRQHALWTLDGLDQRPWPTLAKSHDDADPKVRAAAIRISEGLLAERDRGEVLSKWLALARTEAVPEVQQQLALSLGNASAPEADQALAALWLRAPETLYLRDAVLTGLKGRELELLEALLAKDEWKTATPSTEIFLSGLARCVMLERGPARAAKLFELIANLPDIAAERRIKLLEAMALDAVELTRRPVKLPAQPPLLSSIDPKALPRLRTALNKLQPTVTWPGKPLPPGTQPVRPLTAEEQLRFESGKQLYTAVCAACHQAHGNGLDGLAPPLVDSEWVLGPLDRLARIALQGVRGPLKVKGTTYYLDMPGLGLAFSDDQLAAILTYLRREWEHPADPVTPEAIATIRAATKERTDSWTQEELLKLP